MKFTILRSVGKASHTLSVEKMCREELTTGLKLLTLERPAFEAEPWLASGNLDATVP